MQLHCGWAFHNVLPQCGCVYPCTYPHDTKFRYDCSHDAANDKHEDAQQ